MQPIDPYLKTTRAKRHLDDLRGALDTFYHLKPYRFTRQDDVKNQVHLIRFKVDPTPDHISLIAGDLFYNLRASLDQLAWCLAKLPSPQRSYPKGTQFPILDRRDVKRMRKETRGIATGAVAIIESLQPYNTPDPPGFKGHLLWRLNKLCNIDKHMRIPVFGHSGKWMLPANVATQGYRFESLDDYFEMRIPLGMKDQMTLDPPVSMKVVFGDSFWGVSCDFAEIESMYEFVTNTVIPRFSGFLK